MAQENLFYLLQVNDALFPIGAYSHSQGLETYIQRGIVRDVRTAEEYIKNKLRWNLLYTELLAARFAYEYAAGTAPCDEQIQAAEKSRSLRPKEWSSAAGESEDCGEADCSGTAVQKLIRLEEILEASRLPSEQREAVRKMGSRFAKTVQKLGIPECETGVFAEYLAARKGKSTSHCCVYGVFCAVMGIDEEQVLSHYLYAQTSAMVTNCVKTVPLSQTAGQQLLAGCYEEFEEILKEVMRCSEEDLGRSAPGFDLRGMQHESLYSRLYMS